ncbi:PREDICTED: uncharacterized protein LOC105965938 [Erythranthe guttata]|uniref:uncharacterized protein LOC105965938 n=1 Tax=Erythranthe guttata TaxID=4155 RepID=UPI00064D8405|nr:PREDICTED: uncharacterized protein LOC105965938 [Erythranthe guttata]|eukprot:XP_012845938.1 PREDICTED: uncharacterized protein LOC105965938 [Erythranthe guttata]
MSVLIWNIRGAGNPKSLLYLLKIITQRKPQIVAILEPKQQVNKITKIAQQTGYKNYTHGNPLNPYIWVFWRDEVNWQTLEIHPQCLTAEVVIPNIFSGKMTFVYAKCNRQERLPLWDYLSHHSSTCHEPWVIGGDFNVIKTLDEKQGGSNAHMPGMQDFNDFLVDARLTDAGFVGNIFTWSNNQRGQNRIWQRLDRILLNAEAFTAISARVDHLPRLESDHCPLLLNFGQLQTKPSRFYFQKMWTEHHNYQDFVATFWQQIIPGGRANFESKLANLRKALRKWNWEVFGKLEDNISSMQSNIADMEARLSHAWEDDLFTECQKTKTDLVQQLEWENALLATKARVKWLEEGDRNTKYFHARIKERKKRNQITLKLDDGSFTSDCQLIGAKALAYFDDLFHATPYHLDQDLFSHVEAKVTTTMNTKLCEIPDEDEVYKAIKDLSPDSAPGQDGFTGYFYVRCWSIIKEDFMLLVSGYFQGDYLSKCMSTTLLFLLPKVSNPENLTQFRPISLGNFANKVISRIIASRLNAVLPQIISEEQSGFLKDRSIHESIAIAQELVSDIDRKVEGGNIIFKFDMSKAYDRLEWRFLLKALHALGFSHPVQHRLAGWQSKLLSFGGRITLVRSVLFSLPTHTLSSAVVPKQTIVRMERLFRKFLWGKYEGSGINWINWTTICQPKDEGGLGFRSLLDTKKIMAGKLAWRVLEGKTLWARFARAKYGYDFQSQIPAHASLLWRELFPHLQLLENYSRWIVGKGDIDFWRDRWIDNEGLDETQSISFREAKEQPQQFTPQLQPEQQTIFDLIELDERVEDRLIFTKSISGNFNVADYWELIRSKASPNPLAKKIWHPKIPYNIGAFFWKLSYGAIPVDLALRRRGCMTPSKCWCCAAPKQESLSHLFIQSDIARGVWSNYARIWQKPYVYGSMKHLVQVWMVDASINTQDGFMELGTLMFGCWEIWKSRCRAIFEDTPMNTTTITRSIFSHLRALNDAFLGKRPMKLMGRLIIQQLNLEVKPPPLTRGSWIKWNPPNPLQVKVNVDGSRKGDECSGGGLIRTHDGSFIRGFSNFYGQGNHILAEAQTILDGLRICHEMGFTQVKVESDSKLVIDMIYHKAIVAWELIYVIRCIRRLLKDDWHVMHIYREGNRVADGLAKLAHEHKERKLFKVVNELPRCIRPLLLHDRIGIPQFRRFSRSK